MQKVYFSSDKFREENTSQYTLSIRYSTDGFSFCIHDNDDKLLLFSHKSLSETPQRLGHLMRDILSEEELLQRDYKVVYLMDCCREKVLMPSLGLTEEEEYEICGLSMEVGEGRQMLVSQLRATEYRLAEPFGLEALRELRSQYHSIRILNSAYSLITDALCVNMPDRWQLFVDIEDGYFDVLLMRNRKIHLFNSFVYNSIPDLIYYLMLCLKIRNLKADYVRCYLSGSQADDVQMNGLLRKYFKNLQVQVHEVPKESGINGTYFYHLLNLHTCE